MRVDEVQRGWWWKESAWASSARSCGGFTELDFAVRPSDLANGHGLRTCEQCRDFFTLDTFSQLLKTSAHSLLE